MRTKKDKRRKKIVGVLFVLLLLASGAIYFTKSNEEIKITILYTNDTHSRLEAFSSKHQDYAGQGGFAKRATYINKVRSQEAHVLLFDAGDVSQGTPYYNVYGAEPAFRLMSLMKYDGMTIGNHEFDNGIDDLYESSKFAKFPFISANYDFSETKLASKVKAFEVYEIEGVRIGVFGLGIDFKGLVTSELHDNVVFSDPLEEAKKMEKVLKEDYECDYIICLSHLGLENTEGNIGDIGIAKNTEFVNMIIGGHSHSLLEKPLLEKNLLNKEVEIVQVYKAGMLIGRTDVFFN